LRLRRRPADKDAPKSLNEAFLILRRIVDLSPHLPSGMAEEVLAPRMVSRNMVSVVSVSGTDETEGAEVGKAPEPAPPEVIAL
jgi:hypothetical protein